MPVTVTGTLDGPISTAIVGAVEVQLCGYGSQVPRIQAKALIARLTSLATEIPVSAAGTFSFVVAGNDEIIPAATYYTVTIRDENGDIAQVNAYRFLTSGSPYNLNNLVPYDPNQPPPALPPLITNLLLIVPWSATPAFPGDVYAAYRLVLAGNVTSSTAPNTVEGNLYTYIIIQDPVGGHAFVWPPNFIDASPIHPAPNGITVQTFVMDTTNLRAIGPAAWWP